MTFVVVASNSRNAIDIAVAKANKTIASAWTLEEVHLVKRGDAIDAIEGMY